MPINLELAVVLTTYERPEHLERSLASLALQCSMEGRFEVVVADDGSTDRTHSIVQKFSQTANFPVRLATHPHCGFRVALCRNDGVRASSAPYLLFSDSDCIFPPDHLYKHLCARRPGLVRSGDCFRLDREATDRLDLAAIASQEYRHWVSRDERQRVRRRRYKDQCYRWMGHSTRPKLTGCNIAISRVELEAVNGFDENFVGWGCEDDDLAFRLRKADVQIGSALGYTCAYHMWHPTDPSRPVNWTDGPNVGRLELPDRPIRCPVGLVRSPNDDSERSRQLLLGESSKAA
jgi:glycosyltransferase involved in cell wall biosynthesis